MKVLVTGGAGYIGSHAVQALLKSQYEVLVLDNLSTGFRESLPKEVPFLLGDVRDHTQLSYLLKKHGVQAVMHFAAKLVVPESVSNPLDYYDNNTLGVLSVLKACKDNQLDKIIFSSSAAIYGNDTLGLVNEKSPIAPLTPYGHSKAMSEQILADHESAYGIRSVRLRYFNVAGAAVDGSNGQRTKNATHLIKVVAEAACKKRSHLNIWGTDYPTPDGTCIRDYIHVQDLVDLHVLALQHLAAGNPGGAFNCGYGKGYSVLDVINSMKRISGVDFPVEKSPRREGDAISLFADPELIKKQFGWIPKYENIDLICQSTFDWEKKLP